MADIERARQLRKIAITRAASVTGIHQADETCGKKLD